MKVKISEITVKKRIRKDLGDISRLKESILKFGLINPVTISDKKVLIAGYRRLMAARSLGWSDIECNMINARTKLAMLQIEVDENINRKDFTSSEMNRYEEEKKYLSAKGFMRIWLWLIRLFESLKEWLEGKFRD
ncbi:MAG: ParB N-terminal domain-containing protein [Spirochaetes bacterium]|nr:ParB N-terminal domain-containing protein [Spirochaetota bacterium]